MGCSEERTEHLPEAVDTSSYERHVHEVVRKLVAMSSPSTGATVVDRYWSGHVVCSQRFQSAKESEDYLGWRFRKYPLFRECSGLYGDHHDEVVLDYGCGPGNDLVGFAIYSKARKIIGMDVSKTALQLAAQRLSLHAVANGRVELIGLSDAIPAIDLPDSSVDFVNCQGVLHHVSSPEQLLREFMRVLKPTGRAVIMVYNKDSLWFHLYTAYEKLIVEGAFSGIDVAAAFSMNVDGEACPIARCYEHLEFKRLCEIAGFEATYMGGYLSETEIQAMTRSLLPAQSDMRLAHEHRSFLNNLTFDSRELPVYRGYHAGIGGVFRLSAWRKAREEDQGSTRKTIARLDEVDARCQRAQTEAYYLRLEQQLADLECRYSGLAREVEELRRWRLRVMSYPGVSLALAGRRWVFRVLGWSP